MCENKTITVEYLKSFTHMQKTKLLVFYGTIWLCVNEWIMLNKTISVK